MAIPKPTLLIACGALGREVTQLIRGNGWRCFEVQCLPAILHNTPSAIVPAMREKIAAAKSGNRYGKILALFGDCGTGGLLDQFLEQEGVERIAGDHCYNFFAGKYQFEQMMDEEIGTFFLTDYLARFFDRLIISGLGIDRNPELLGMYFGNYTRLVYLAQTDDPEIDSIARAAAARLGLSYERKSTGYGGLGTFLQVHAGEGSTWPI